MGTTRQVGTWNGTTLEFNRSSRMQGRRENRRTEWAFGGGGHRKFMVRWRSGSSDVLILFSLFPFPLAHRGTSAERHHREEDMRPTKPNAFSALGRARKRCKFNLVVLELRPKLADLHLYSRCTADDTTVSRRPGSGGAKAIPHILSASSRRRLSFAPPLPFLRQFRYQMWSLRFRQGILRGAHRHHIQLVSIR